VGLLAELKGAFLGVVDQAMGFKRAMIAGIACPKDSYSSNRGLFVKLK
jgi:hypothetical protein